MKSLIIPLSIILTLFFCLPVSATESGNGSIEGQVTNGTANGDGVTNLEVVLTTYSGTNEIEKVTSTTNTEGHFAFQGLSTESGYIFQAMVEFQGVEYFSQAINLDSEEIIHGADIRVFDSTTSDETISIVTSHTIVYPNENTLEINEYFMFVNNSDKTYIGVGDTPYNGNIETLRFPLPKNATGLTLSIGVMDCCIVANEDGFSDTMPVKPGMHEVVYSYEIPKEVSGYLLSREVSYPTDNFDLLVEYDGNIEMSGNSLTIQEPLYIEGVYFSHITGQNLVQGDVLQVSFPELTSKTSSTNIIWFILIPIILLAGLVVIYFMKKRPIAQTSVTEDKIEYGIQALLDEIARLDDEYESGSIEEENYHTIRADLKNQVVELMQRSGTKELP